MRGARRPEAATSLVALGVTAYSLLALPAQARAQSAATVTPTDAVYADMERLEAFGLLPRGVGSQRPLSFDRLAWLAGEARGWLGVRGDDFSDGVRTDLVALLARVERRLKVGEASHASGSIDVELGGGRSPGRLFPDPKGYRIGSVHAVSNPLWAGHGGRSYGDRVTAAAAARIDVGGNKVAFALGGRGARLDASGPVGGRGRNAVESASARVVLGSVAIEMGRSPVVWGRTGTTPLLLSEGGVPLDLVRLSSDRPASVHVLGDLDFSVYVADLGPRQFFPHTKEIGIRVEARPSPGVELGISVLNKQGGDGAPPASLGRRLWDASVLGPAIFGDTSDEFSDKLLGVDVRWTFSSLRGAEITLDAVLTDFEKRRIGDVLDASGGYRLGLAMPRLGGSQRHMLALEGVRLGVFMYRHTQFQGGLATERLVQGSPLGPDARGVRLRYAYENPVRALRLELLGALENRRADEYGNRFAPERDVYRTKDLPDEIRARVQGWVTLWLRDGTTLLRLGAGLEGVRNPTYPVASPSRSAFAFLAELRRTF